MTTVRIDDYPHQLAGHCGSGSLRDLLAWAGLGWDGPPSEGLVFGLGGGLSFMYLRVAGPTPPVYLVGRNAEMETDLCQRLGIDVEERRTDDPDLAWRWVTDELDDGRPVMIHADIAELPYLRVRLSNTRHDLVVIGYDDDRGIAWVVDNDRDDVQEVPLEALARARSSSGFPDPARHTTFPMRFPNTLPDLHAAARDAAAASASTLREGAGDLFDPVGLPPTAVVGSGLDGVETFAEDIARWPDLFSDEELDQALGAVSVFTEKAGTGGGMFRRLQAGFCADVARHTGDDRFAAAADAYRRCADGWSSLARSCRDHPDDHVAITELAGELPALERAAVTALEHAAGEPR